MRTGCLALMTVLLTASAPARAEELSQSQALNMMFGALKTWGSERREAKSARSFFNERTQWTRELKAAGELADGAMTYFNGLEVGTKVAGWRLKVDTASGQTLSRSIDSGNGRLARFGLDRPGRGWSAEAVLGLRQGQFNNDSLNIKYTLKFD